MKIAHSLHTAIGYAFLTTFTAFVPRAVLAQQQSETVATHRNANAPGYDLQIIDGHLAQASGKVDATLEKVIDALRDQHPEANIVMSPGLGKLKVGDLKLRAGRLAEELEAVRVATGEKFDLKTPGEPMVDLDPKRGLPPDQGKTPNAGLFVLREAQKPPQEQRVVEAFNIGPYLEWLAHRPGEERKPTAEKEQEALDRIELMIVQTITDFKGEEHPEDQPKWQYHRGATLLVIIGSLDSVEIARKIVNALPGMLPGRGQPNVSTAQQHAAEEAFRSRYGIKREPPVVQSDVPPQDGARP
jgi:hypothetical protein